MGVRWWCPAASPAEMSQTQPAKFICSFFRNARITDAVHDLLRNRDGLMLSICNGFQAPGQAGTGALRRDSTHGRRLPH